MLELDEYTSRVLTSLVEGFRAREGMKPRARSLSEYELARRLGVTGYSYAQFETSEERGELLRALSELQHRRLITRAQPSGRYDTFVPADDLAELPATVVATAPPLQAPEHPSEALLRQISAQLEESIALLRSIDRKLGPD